MADLKEENLIEIVRLYEKHCGRGRSFGEVMYKGPEAVLKQLREHSWSEYRVGSKWDGHSKLIFSTDWKGNIKASFYPNFNPKEKKGKKHIEAEEAGRKFDEEVGKYLNLE